MFTMRVVRGLMKKRLISQGYIHFHAACLIKNGVGICITGEKFAGKTSTLLHLMANLQGDFVSNDKVLMTEQGSQLQAYATPHKIGVRAGTMFNHPELMAWCHSETPKLYPDIDLETLHHIQKTVETHLLQQYKIKTFFAPQELAEVFGVSVYPMASIKLFLIPVFEPDLKQPKLIPRSDDEIVSYLATQCLDRSPQGFLQQLFSTVDTRPIKTQWEALFRKHLPNIKIYELHQGAETQVESAKLVEEAVLAL